MPRKKVIASEWNERQAQQEAALRESSVRVIAQMKKEAEQNKKALDASLKADLLKAFRKNVLNQAESKIKSSLNPGLHASINQGFIQDLAKGVNT